MTATLYTSQLERADEAQTKLKTVSRNISLSGIIVHLHKKDLKQCVYHIVIECVVSHGFCAFMNLEINCLHKRARFRSYWHER